MNSFYIISDGAPNDNVEGVDAAVVAVGGEIDYAASPPLRERIFEHIKAGRRHVVLDLSAATFIDSTAIGVIVGAFARLKEEGGGTLAVVCAEENRRVLQIFQITGLESTIEMHSTREQALSALAMAG